MKQKNLIKPKIGPVFKLNNKAGKRTVINVGGARSGKSHAVAQLLIMRALNLQGINVGITRKTMPALKMTAARLVTDLLKEYGLYSEKNHNKMEHYYNLGKSRIQFFSLDNPEKIKSAEFNYIWMEEATEFTYEDYVTLLTRLSAPIKEPYKNQIFLTLNPSDSNSWIAKKLLSAQNTQIIKSSYKDNPFLSKDYINTLLGLKDIDENYYRVFALGQWGANKNIVYDNYTFVDEIKNTDNVIWGLDFGFNNPSALVKLYISDEGVYTEEKLYKSGLTNSALIKNLAEIIPPSQRHESIYADAAEPARIAEISEAGFNIHPALKDVKAGILSVKTKKLFINKNSSNLIKEIQGYCWKTDLNGNALEEAVKFNDHALDALRYALHTHFFISGKKPDVSFF
ncbi:Phage terminase, large subunit [Elusimicrobium minutum Pei191]|uniref:Phage terminase, large subunit n=1 Tax=Elusimicrobium minutum (strain Pei191) TaxID=445932 RepID=B2KD07_ELUMP|nr:PBSX family phage terminase large subunit [Elusimicrobium minutum]ACC98403.1 Phage terminase, large subunit [Elusimicrobium minutum Pei191]